MISHSFIVPPLGLQKPKRSALCGIFILVWVLSWVLKRVVPLHPIILFLQVFIIKFIMLLVISMGYQHYNAIYSSYKKQNY